MDKKQWITILTDKYHSLGIRRVVTIVSFPNLPPRGDWEWDWPSPGGSELTDRDLVVMQREVIRGMRECFREV